MDKLFQGVLRFQREDFSRHHELFSRLGRRQQPHTLFVGCSDSRVVPTLITNTDPGELFLVRNVANIVPPWAESDQDASTAAAISYAVQVLAVGTIVVCGHSNCGGCAALHMTPAELEGLPAVSRWLQHSAEVPGRVARLSAEAGNSDAADREWLTEQINVLVQMRHLLTYPFIAERVRAGTLSVQGWYYVIDSGEVLVYDDARGNFEKVKA
ncbi:carbonic anhydrase [bacterium]|nr:carbonic anhydrase [bacterium]